MAHRPFQPSNLLTPLLAFCLTVAQATVYNQVQFYQQSARYGVAITSALSRNGTQLRIRMAAPEHYGWFALGSGSYMDGAVMFILYPNEVGDGLTLSVRTTTAHNTPTLLQDNYVDARLLASSVKDGVMTADLEWRGDTRGIIYNVKQPFIWSVGPNQTIASDEVNFPIRAHSQHGVFFADMPQSQNANVMQPEIDGVQNQDVGPQPASYGMLKKIHAGFLVAAFLIVFPIGVLGLRLNLAFSFNLHWVSQLFACVAVLTGFVVSLVMSVIGIQYSSFNQPHQIVGILVCLLVGIQAYFGREHHIHYFLYKRRTWYSYVHLSLGRVVLYGGMVNVVLGFNLCGLRTAAIIVGGINIPLILLIEFMSARHQVRIKKNLIVSSEPLELGHYHKITDVTVTERMLSQVETNAEYIT